VNRIGVDIGGTNTDIVVMDGDMVRFYKLPSTSAAPSQAVHQGLADLGIALSDTALFAHGTTIATNAVIQRTGARAGLLTTKGFRDVLQIRRTTRGELYDFQWDPPHELVPRRWRLEIDERTSAEGEVLVRPDPGAVRGALETLRKEGIESLAVAFINSYANAGNEEECRRLLTASGAELPVYLSSELLPAWREFERTSTAVVGAYVGPVFTSYIRALETALKRGGYRYDLMVMLSNGGLATAASAMANPVSTLVSGPAAGVIAQVAIAGAAGVADLVGMDIGGTSTDVSVVLGGTPAMRSEYDIEFGTVVGFPMIDIHSIGAGGGTIAWLDEGLMLHCGPRSAGAEPGPACYERGGTEPTVTDAHVVVGRLHPERLLDGAMPISAGAARRAVDDLATRCGLGVEAMAAGIIVLTVSNVAGAVRQLTVERGVNPRELTLVAYGGGGPTLACDVAEELEIPTVLIPPHPGLTSAAGLLMTDIRHDFQRALLKNASACSWSDVVGAFGALIASGDAVLEREGVERSRRAFELAADLRYIGQTHELTIALGGEYTEQTHSRLSELLRVEHEARYAHAPEGEQDVEIVTLRVAAVGRMPRFALDRAPKRGAVEPEGSRKLYLKGEWHDSPVYRRAMLAEGSRVSGPAIIEQMDSTTVLLPGWVGLVDAAGNLLIRREAA
jgi:N-methylhydantoinase A